MDSTTSGHRRRTSTRVSPAPPRLGAVGGWALGSGAGSSTAASAGVAFWSSTCSTAGSTAGSGAGRGRRCRPHRSRLGGLRQRGPDGGSGGVDRPVLGRGRRRGRGSRGARGAGDGSASFEPVESGREAVGGVVGAGQQHPRTEQLEQQPRGGGAAHLGQAGRQDVGGPAQVGRAEPGRLGHQPLTLVLGDVDEAGRRGPRDGGHDDQVAQPPEQVLGEPARVLAGLDDLVDHPEDGGAVGGREGVDHLVEQRVRGVAEQPGGQLVGDAVGPGAADELVEDRERVARRSPARTDDEGQGGRLDPDLLLGAEVGEVARHQPRRDQPERVVVGARADRRDDLLRLGGREDEAQVLRRLLDQLEQRVEALRRDHVGLVDDVDLVLAADRREERLLTQVTGVVDAAVGGRVDLDHVDRPGPAPGQVAAAVALPAGVGHRRLLAVERPGQDPRAGGLAAAPRPAEEVGVVDPVAGQRGPQRLGHVLLPDDLGEGLRPVATVEGER